MIGNSPEVVLATIKKAWLTSASPTTKSWVLQEAFGECRAEEENTGTIREGHGFSLVGDGEVESKGNALA